MQHSTDIIKHIQSIEKKITELKSLDEKINMIASYARIITRARRCSLFIFEKEKSELKSIYNDELSEHIIIKSNIGLVGYAFHKKKTVLENDVTSNPNFFDSVDKKFNFTTRHILAVPLMDKDDHCLGVIELLNKKMGFDKYDQEHIEMLVPLITSLLISSDLISDENANDQASEFALLQKKITAYLDDKRLYLMNDGNAYYKILDMKRTYFIGADICYQLSTEPSRIDIYYNTDEEEFLSLNVTAKFDIGTEQILISEKNKKQNFNYYPFEKDLYPNY